MELEGTFQRTPKETPLKVVARSAHAYAFDIGFGDHFRVLVAIGDVRGPTHGVLQVEMCWVSLWYSADARLFTADFHREWR